MSTVITSTDTPETDGCTLLAIDIDFGGNFEAVHAQVSRNLERQRNKAIDECIALRQMVRELRDALEDSHALNVNWSSDADPETLSYYSEYKATIKDGKEALTKAIKILP